MITKVQAKEILRLWNEIDELKEQLNTGEIITVGCSCESILDDKESKELHKSRRKVLHSCINKRENQIREISKDIRDGKDIR